MVVFNLMDQYFDLIQKNLKIKEGRIFKSKFKDIKVNDIISFCNNGNTIDCIITEINQYSSFYNMLLNEGIENFLPGIFNINEGVDTYYSIPNYKNEEALYGVVAFSFTKI